MSPYSFGEASSFQLMTCSVNLQRVANKLIKRVDFSVLEGKRSDARQIELYNTVLPDGSRLTHLDGVTELSAHQVTPEDPLSHAFDLLPYPAVMHGVNIWRDEFRLTLFAGEVIATGWELGVELLWGGDWNGDGSKADHTFFDGPHYQEVLF